MFSRLTCSVAKFIELLHFFSSFSPEKCCMVVPNKIKSMYCNAEISIQICKVCVFLGRGSKDEDLNVLCCVYMDM